MLTAAQNERIDLACDGITSREERITDRLRQVEQMSIGHLVGLDFRLKGRDRIKDKVAATFEDNPGSDVDTILSDVPDTVRYTFQYEGDDYTKGVVTDITRLTDQGCELIKVKNSWDGSEYKGINSQWRDDQTGQRFEIQFHTSISFEAKQVTHGAYERLRNPCVTSAEARELAAFQREVSASIPVPPEARDIQGP